MVSSNAERLTTSPVALPGRPRHASDTTLTIWTARISISWTASRKRYRMVAELRNSRITALLLQAANFISWKAGPGAWKQKYAKSIGKHNIKFGGIYMRYNVFRTNPQNATVNYATRADLLANTPAQTIITFGNGLYDASNYTLGFFAQDNWKISKTFSLDLGVRYDFFSKYVAHSRVTTQDYALYNLNGLIDNRFDFGPVRDPNDPYNSDGGINLAPRLGFSWDPRRQGPDNHPWRGRHYVQPHGSRNVHGRGRRKIPSFPCHS